MEISWAVQDYGKYSWSKSFTQRWSWFSLIKSNLLRASCTLPVLSDSEGASPKLWEFSRHLSNQPKSQFLTSRLFVIWFSSSEDWICTTRKEEHSKRGSRTWVSLPPVWLLNFKIPVLTGWGHFWDEETPISTLGARLSSNRIGLPKQRFKFYWWLNFILRLIPHPILWGWRSIEDMLPFSFNMQSYNSTKVFLQALHWLTTGKVHGVVMRLLQDQIDLPQLKPCGCNPYINLWQEKIPIQLSLPIWFGSPWLSL